MKKMKFFVTALALMLSCVAANAVETIGVANYKKIEAEYNFAKQTYKQLDDKIMELQQFVIDKDKEFKAIESPIQKKNFEEKTQKEYKAKEDALLNLKVSKQDQIYENILNATKAVAKQKGITMVLDYRVIFIGGTDISDDVIKYLNATPTAKK
ncbi:OmpH family outer membrane protein [bacterium]|nr:OmpH family outer membrane protein [bacterium]